MEAPAIDGISFSLLDVIPNPPRHQCGYYRILTASSAIKYLAFLPSKPTFPNAPDYRGDRLGFTTIPGGDWNIGRIGYDTTTDRLVLQSTEKGALQDVEDVWHPA